MLRQIELDDPAITVAQCQAKLRGIEARIGEVTDVFADTAAGDAGGNVTVITANNRSRVPANSLFLIAEGGDAPAGKSLAIAGTAWIEGAKQVVKVYR